MTTLEMPVETIETAPAIGGGELVLETLKLVARRADALSRRSHTTTREADRRVWLRAELEIFETSSRVHRAEQST